MDPSRRRVNAKIARNREWCRGGAGAPGWPRRLAGQSGPARPPPQQVEPQPRWYATTPSRPEYDSTSILRPDTSALQVRSATKGMPFDSKVTSSLVAVPSRDSRKDQPPQPRPTRMRT